MVELLNTLKTIMNGALNILQIPIPLARDFSVTLWEVLLFIMLGSILWRLVTYLFLDTE